MLNGDLPNEAGDWHELHEKETYRSSHSPTCSGVTSGGEGRVCRKVAPTLTTHSLSTVLSTGCAILNTIKRSSQTLGYKIEHPERVVDLHSVTGVAAKHILSLFVCTSGARASPPQVTPKNVNPTPRHTFCQPQPHSHRPYNRLNARGRASSYPACACPCACGGRWCASPPPGVPGGSLARVALAPLQPSTLCTLHMDDETKPIPCRCLRHHLHHRRRPLHLRRPRRLRRRPRRRHRGLRHCYRRRHLHRCRLYRCRLCHCHLRHLRLVAAGPFAQHRTCSGSATRGASGERALELPALSVPSLCIADAATPGVRQREARPF